MNIGCQLYNYQELLILESVTSYVYSYIYTVWFQNDTCT